jgi:heterodisulfide reductase subunit B
VNYAYYPGCSALGSSEDYERSTQAVCDALGARLEPVPDWNCCGSTPAHAVNAELSAALCARNLSIAGRMPHGGGLLTSCPSCLSNLKMAAHRMEDAAFRRRVDELLDMPGGVFPRTRSVMQMLLEDFGAASITRRTLRPLLGVRLVPYYGCLMSRPAEVMQFGNPENPTAMEELLRACGAEDIADFPVKTECCGASHGIPSQEVTSRLSGRILALAADYGADALVVACPLCQMNLDLRQEQAAGAVGLTRRIPALYFTQLMGLAFGVDSSRLGLEKLCVSAQPLLDKLRTARENAAFGAQRAGAGLGQGAGKAHKAEVRP